MGDEWTAMVGRRMAMVDGRRAADFTLRNGRRGLYFAADGGWVVFDMFTSAFGGDGVWLWLVRFTPPALSCGGVKTGGLIASFGGGPFDFAFGFCFGFWLLLSMLLSLLLLAFAVAVGFRCWLLAFHSIICWGENL